MILFCSLYFQTVRKSPDIWTWSYTLESLLLPGKSTLLLGEAA